MKVLVALIVLFGLICDLHEACSWTKRTRGRGRNPKIITTLPPVTEAVEQATEAPTEKATTTTKPPTTTEGVVELTTEVAGGEVNTEAPTEKATEATTTAKPPTPTEGVVELTTEVAGGEVNTEAPTEKATESTTTAKPPTEAPTEKATEVATETPAAATTEEIAQETTKAPTETAAPTEPKAIEATTELVEPLTRPTSVHRFFKQSAFVSSTTDDRTCIDVAGVCRAECDITTEYVLGRFQCPPGTNCCGKR